MTVPLALSGVGGDPVGSIVGGALVVLLSGAIGVAVRYSEELRAEEVAGLRSRDGRSWPASSTTPWHTMSPPSRCRRRPVGSWPPLDPKRLSRRCA